MAGACVTLPEYPDAGEPCVNGTDLVLVARCVNGLRVLMWVYATELGELAPVVATSARPCAKVKLLETAENCGWSPDQVIAVAKSLGLK